MADGRDILSEGARLPKEEIDKIWEEVKVNNKRLRDCAGPHEFVATAGAKLRGKYRCWKCGGVVDTIAFKWYTEGLEHGRKIGR